MLCICYTCVLILLYISLSRARTLSRKVHPPPPPPSSISRPISSCSTALLLYCFTTHTSCYPAVLLYCFTTHASCYLRASRAQSAPAARETTPTVLVHTLLLSLLLLSTTTSFTTIFEHLAHNLHSQHNPNCLVHAFSFSFFPSVAEPQLPSARFNILLHTI
jgi:hypothetical protein